MNKDRINIGRAGVPEEYFTIHDPVKAPSDELEMATGAKYDSVLDAAIVPNEPFLKRAWKFVSGKTKAGQIFHTIAGAAIGIATGVNIDPVLSTLTEPLIGGTTMDMNWIELALMAVPAILTFVTARGIVKGFLNELFQEVADIVKVVKKAREANSPEGKSYSDEEKKLIQQEVYDCVILLYNRFVRSWVARLFGLKVKTKG